MKIFLATVSNSDQHLGTTPKPCFESKVNLVRDLQNRSNKVRLALIEKKKYIRVVFQFIDGDHDDGDDDKLCAAAAH